ncbi:hypothetical protein XAC2852_20066 [Xanthomonas citri pv. citri]|nr:hypothetical protein XAC2852_20066 [Xanthomonas citri pv. citri]
MPAHCAGTCLASRPGLKAAKSDFTQRPVSAAGTLNRHVLRVHCDSDRAVHAHLTTARYVMFSALAAAACLPAVHGRMRSDAACHAVLLRGQRNPSPR